MADKIPAKRMYVTLVGREYEVIDVDKMTFPELKEAKAVSKMPPSLMWTAFGQGDPDAWLAVLYISIRRATPVATVKDITDLIGDTPLGDIVDTLRDVTPEVASEPDPPQPNVEQSSEPNENGSGETTQPSLIPEHSGLQT